MNKNYVSYLTYTKGGVDISFLMEKKSSTNWISITFTEMTDEWRRKNPTNILEVWDNPNYIFNMFLYMDEELGDGKIAFDMWKNNTTTPEELMSDDVNFDASPIVDRNSFGEDEWSELMDLCIEAKTNPHDIYDMLKEIYTLWIELPVKKEDENITSN